MQRQSWRDTGGRHFAEDSPEDIGLQHVQLVTGSVQHPEDCVIEPEGVPAESVLVFPAVPAV